MIKSIIGETKLKNVTIRRNKVVLHRARIDHNFTTPSYLLKRENSPDFTLSVRILTAQHILIDCPIYQPVRVKYFSSLNLHDLFSSVHPLSVVAFLKDINVLNVF